MVSTNSVGSATPSHTQPRLLVRQSSSSKRPPSTINISSRKSTTAARTIAAGTPGVTSHEPSVSVKVPFVATIQPPTTVTSSLHVSALIVSTPPLQTLTTGTPERPEAISVSIITEVVTTTATGPSVSETVSPVVVASQQNVWTPVVLALLIILAIVIVAGFGALLWFFVLPRLNKSSRKSVQGRGVPLQDNPRRNSGHTGYQRSTPDHHPRSATTEAGLFPRPFIPPTSPRPHIPVISQGYTPPGAISGSPPARTYNSSSLKVTEPPTRSRTAPACQAPDPPPLSTGRGAPGPSTALHLQVRTPRISDPERLAQDVLKQTYLATPALGTGYSNASIMDDDGSSIVNEHHRALRDDMLSRGLRPGDLRYQIGSASTDGTRATEYDGEGEESHAVYNRITTRLRGGGNAAAHEEDILDGAR
jgi:hypothetical protein